MSRPSANEVLYPRTDPEFRFRLYSFDEDGEPEVRAACASPEAVGVALVTLAEDRREAGLAAEIVGVLDAREHRWIVGMWTGRERSPFR